MRRTTVKKDDALLKSESKVELRNTLKAPTFDISKISFEVKCKNESQKNLVNLINKNDITICSGPAGTGKAQPLDSPILTPNGWTTMGEIEVGDRVISVDGNTTIVTGTYPQGSKDIWELTFSDGTKAECCSEHLWFTQTEKDRNNRKWNKTIDGQRTRYKYEKEGCVKSTLEIVESLYDKRGRVNHSIPIVNPVNFNEQSVEIDPYVMGALLGDGCFRGYVGFSSEDEDILNNISKSIDNDMILNKRYSEYDYAIVKSTKSKTKNKYVSYLKELNLFNKLSYEKFIPECYLFNSIENRIKLLNGLMDTDGTVSSDGTFVSFCSTSLELIKGVKELVQSLGGIATDHKPKKNTYIYNGEKKIGKKSYTITLKMNPDINPFSLKRKFDLVVPKTKYKPIRYIVAARLIGIKEAKCISVDNPSHLYITNDYLVTHNTFIACGQALKLLKKDDKFTRIILVKSVTVLEGEDIGYLKGDIATKMEPVMISFLDNFHKIIGEDNTKRMLDMGIIEVLPLAYIRGRSIDNAIIIVDEAQNISLKNMRSTMTRIGEYSKMIITGDSKQIDIKNRKLSSLDTVVRMFSNKIGVGTMTFEVSDIVRSKVVMMIENEFDAWEEANSDQIIKKSTL